MVEGRDLMADDPDAQSEATRDTAKTKDNADLVKLWLDELALADKGEGDWRDDAGKVVDIYRNSSPRMGDVPNAKDRRFNILFSNVETVIPAIYNSTPVPDVRRRFNDDDPAGKEVADLIERAISSSVDAYDFDEGMRHDIKDMELTGRGLSRVRYKPYFTQEDADAGNEAGEDEVADDEAGETVAYEEVACEHVAWRHFRHGPGRTWQDVPWICFDHFLTREELVKLNPEIGGKVNLDTTIAGKDDNKGDGENLKEVFKRAYVREIWDKDSRKVLFIAPSYKDAPLKNADDPLGLTGFYPIPKPLYAIETSDDLTPVIPYHIYRDQAEELERVSRRIMALVESIKSCGAYDGSMQEIAKLAEADDNELVPIENVARYAEKGIEGGITWWPMDSAVKALAQLVEHRESIKQVIYEITGISDILRGQTEANETATAQNIKQQWGSLRIQLKQGAIQKYARDLFRLKAEIIATKFDWKTIELMTGLSYPDQAMKQQAQLVAQQMQQAQQPVPENIQKVIEKPAREEVEQLLRSDAMRNFRVDVESDSTIRADMTRNQQNMTLFLQGTAQFAQAMGPIVMTFKEMTPAVLEVYTAFARNFKLGKQAEDALDGVADKAKVMADQPQPPDPAQQAEQAKLAAEQQKMQAEMAMKEKELELKRQEMEMGLQQKQAELDLKRQELELKAQAQEQELAMKREEMAQKIQLEAQQAEHDQKLKEYEVQQNAQLKEQEVGQKMQLAQTQAEQDAELKRTSTVEDIKLKGLQAAQKAQHADAEFQGNQKRAELSFAADEKRKEQAHKVKTDNEIRLQNDGADYERKQKETEAKKPKVKKVVIDRGKDGKIAGAQVTEH